MPAAHPAAARRNYRLFLMPSCRVLPKIAGQNENASEFLYNVAPNPVTKHLWGTTLAVVTEGCLEAAIFEGMSQGRPHIVAWLGNNAATFFDLPATKPALSTAKMALFVDGTLDGTATFTTTRATPTSTPGTGKMVVLYYEY